MLEKIELDKKMSTAKEAGNAIMEIYKHDLLNLWFIVKGVIL
jgi:hypothetical protein